MLDTDVGGGISLFIGIWEKDKNHPFSKLYIMYYDKLHSNIQN